MYIKLTSLDNLVEINPCKRVALNFSIMLEFTLALLRFNDLYLNKLQGFLFAIKL